MVILLRLLDWLSGFNRLVGCHTPLDRSPSICVRIENVPEAVTRSPNRALRLAEVEVIARDRYVAGGAPIDFAPRVG